MSAEESALTSRPSRETAAATALSERELLDRVANLEAALESRAEIDQAIGMVMLARSCDAATAFRALSELSQNSNTKVRDLAGSMARVAVGGNPTDVDRTLYQAALRLLTGPPETPAP